MKREIKFRAWDGDYMIHFDLQLCNEESMLWFVKTIQDNPVMQYTGLTDKNGFDIYESDILLHPNGEVWQVSFDDRGCFIAHDPKEIDCNVLCDDYDFKVIGNIHENPELLY